MGKATQLLSVVVYFVVEAPKSIGYWTVQLSYNLTMKQKFFLEPQGKRTISHIFR